MSAEEYRKRVYKDVTMPDGFVFTIRKMNYKTLTALLDVYGEAPTGELTEQQKKEIGDKIRKQLPSIISIVIPACVVKPKISVNPTSENELALDDVEPGHLLALVNAITDFSGLTGQAAEERKSFQ